MILIKAKQKERERLSEREEMTEKKKMKDSYKDHIKIKRERGRERMVF